MSYTQKTIKVASKTPGWNLDVWEFLPNDAPEGKKVPVLVMAHGFGAEKAIQLNLLAQTFTEKGYGALVFDYRRWGGSDGTPRNVLIVKEQLEDYRTIIRYARESSGPFDPARVIVWGTSFAGGHAMKIASEDGALAAAIGQCPFSDGIITSLSLSKIPTMRIVPHALFDGLKYILPGYKPTYIRAYGPKGSFALLTEKGTDEGVKAIAKDIKHEYNKIQASAALQVPWHRPGSKTRKIQCPLLLTIGDTDNLCPPAASIKAAKRAPKGEHVRFEGGHFDCYPGMTGYEKNIAAQLEFLQRVVPV